MPNGEETAESGPFFVPERKLPDPDRIKEMLRTTAFKEVDPDKVLGVLKDPIWRAKEKLWKLRVDLVSEQPELARELMEIGKFCQVPLVEKYSSVLLSAASSLENAMEKEGSSADDQS